MADDPDQQGPAETDLARQVARQAERTLAARRAGTRGAWSGLGMFGLIGWSVAAPTLAGALLGGWWDRGHPGGRSWTLVLLAAGLVLGCANAWRWLVRDDGPEDHDE